MAIGQEMLGLSQSGVTCDMYLFRLYVGNQVHRVQGTRGYHVVETSGVVMVLFAGEESEESEARRCCQMRSLRALI